jgi:hypothetical protein
MRILDLEEMASLPSERLSGRTPLLRILHRGRPVRSCVCRRSQIVAYRRDVRCHIGFLRFHERAVELATTPQHSEKRRQTGPLADRGTQEQFYHQLGDVVRSIIWDVGP